jgi:hypothetical protein
MGRTEMVNKLYKFLESRIPFDEECHVLYLLVEIRKILDRDKNEKYPILRFYCDWSVHTEKDRITKKMREIMNSIYCDVRVQIQSPALARAKSKIIDFMYMEDLQAEMKIFLSEYDLPKTLTSQKNNWLEFVKLLVKILADQPINRPCADVRTFAFLPASEGCVYGRIDFTNKIEAYDHYNFGNAY